MFAEVMEWEAKGDSLLRARRFDEAVEAYRCALRSCFQWNRNGDGARACAEIREKIWTVQLDQFECATGVPVGADTVEWSAARLWAKGERAEAECVIEAAVGRGMRSSGEFLDRLTGRWHKQDSEGALRLTVWACRLRGESSGL